jgi:hypothetical protein
MRRLYGTISVVTILLLLTTACAPSHTTPLPEVGARTMENSDDSSS